MLALGGPTALAATKEMLRRARAADLADDFADMLELSAGLLRGRGGPGGHRRVRAETAAQLGPERLT